jgi:hypothetical protein
VALTLAASVAACGKDTAKENAVAPSAVALSGTAPVNPSPNLRRADVEYLEICKDYPGGTGPTVTVNVSVDIDTNGSVDTTFPTTLDAGQCKDVWISGGSVGDTVTVTEVVPTGYTASYVLQTIAGSTLTTNASVAGNSVSANLRSGFGSLVIFTNTPNTPPPPPPPGGIAGCTPGYWKQSQHFDSWPAPYTPNMQFSAVFSNAFPGMTLVQVAAQGGGGLKALGRHTVAALLSSGSVNYGMTPAQVIAAFNAAYASGNYDALHNQFAAMNERGCPLN